MLVGHYAVGFAAKRIAPRVPLAALMAAAMLPDLLTFILGLGGIEHAGLTPGFPRYFGLNAYDIAFSHSLAMDVLWAGVLALTYLKVRSDARGAVTLALVLLSHWVLDFVTHRPEMPLAPGIDRKLGLALWNSIPGTLAIEGGLWVLAITAYVRGTHSIAPTGRYCLWLLTSALTVWFVVTPFSPQPAGDFGTVGLTTFLTVHIIFIVLAYLVDRSRAFRVHLSQQHAEGVRANSFTGAASGHSHSVR